MLTGVSPEGRTALLRNICGLLLTVAAITTISARDPEGLWLRAGQSMLIAGLAMWLPWRLLLPAVLLTWFASNAVRANVDDLPVIRTDALLELPALLLLAVFSVMAGRSLTAVDQEDVQPVANAETAVAGRETVADGVSDERLLAPESDDQHTLPARLPLAQGRDTPSAGALSGSPLSSPPPVKEVRTSTRAAELDAASRPDASLPSPEVKIRGATPPPSDVDTVDAEVAEGVTQVRADEISQLLKRMDETLSMIRALRSSVKPGD